jgi:cysteine desulfurase
MFGGGHERRLRSGTLNVPGIVGMGRAAELASQLMVDERQRSECLRELLLAELKGAFPEVGINGHATDRLSGTLNVRLFGYNADDLQAASPGVAVSSGSACTAATPEPSHVLMAMGLGWDGAQECLRFGIGRSTTEADITEAVTRLRDGANRLDGGQVRAND